MPRGRPLSVRPTGQRDQVRAESVLGRSEDRSGRASFVLVTGSDKSHVKSLFQLLRSIRRFEPELKVVVYDLGLGWRQRLSLWWEFPHEIRWFNYRRYPPHLNIRVARGEYAWKPVIISEVANTHGGIVCWMDAGNILTGDLAALRAFVGDHGFYSPHSSGTVADWTHPGMLAWLGLPAAWDARGNRNLNGACVAFDTRNTEAMAVVEEWGRLALIKDCIAPPGSNRKNHRQDQALLTVLAYRSGVVRAPADKMLGFRTHADID